MAFFASCNDISLESNGKEDAAQQEPKIVWHWENQFTPEEKKKVQKYISYVTEASFRVLGNYPFDVHYFIHRSDNKYEPIPWANTVRGENIQGVRFYINPDFDYDVMFADWTAPHEISHLSIPAVGRKNSWFAEGYASYMQYQIMREMGIYNEEEVKEKYETKFENIRNDYSDSIPFIENARELRSRYNFPAMYWGGAMYFIRIDELLHQEGTNLNDWMKKYQSCCRNKDHSMEMILQSLDKELKTPLFSDLYEICKMKPFPDIYQSLN